MSSGSFDVAQLRLLPSIDELLRTPQVQDLVQSFSRALVVEALRECLAEARVAIRSGSLCPPSDALLIQARSFLLGRQRSRLRSLVNATGVVIHTNLGRAPLSSAALRAVEAVAADEWPRPVRAYEHHPHHHFDLDPPRRSAAVALQRVMGLWTVRHRRPRPG